MNNRSLIMILLLLRLLFSSKELCAQEFAEKSYYLIDSLELQILSENDRMLIDSSLNHYHSSNNDTDKFEWLNHIVQQCWNDEVWPRYNDLMFQMISTRLKQPCTSREKHLFKSNLANAINNKGYFAKNLQGNLGAALAYYLQSLEIEKEIGNQIGIANSENNVGAVYRILGDVQNALKYYHESLSIREQIKDSSGVADSYNNIAVIYKNQGDYDNAVLYHEKALEIRLKLGDKRRISSSYNNLGVAKKDVKDFQAALAYYLAALSIRQELGDQNLIAHSMANIGLVYCDLIEYDKAQDYLIGSLKICEETSDLEWACVALQGLSAMELGSGNKDAALRYAQLSLKYATEFGAPEEISKTAEILKTQYKGNGDSRNALEMFELEIQMRDSVVNESNQKAAIRQQTRYEFEKAQLIKVQQEQERLRIIEQEKTRRNNLQYSGILVFVLLLFIMIFMSGKFQMGEKLAEGLIFFTFLLFFEFLLVLLDTYIEELSKGIPLWKLLFNAVLAGLIFPLHALFENTLKKKVLIR